MGSRRGDVGLLSRLVTVRRAAVGGAAAMLIGAAMVGCSSDDKGAVLPTLTPTPTSSVTQFPKTREGAADFARALIDAMNKAQATGDVSGVVALVSPACTSCERIINFAKRAYGSGGHINGGELTVVDAVSPP